MAGTNFIGDEHLQPDPPSWIIQRGKQGSNNRQFGIGSRDYIDYTGARLWGTEDIDVIRADNQSKVEQGLNAAARIGINGTAEILGNFASIFDVGDYINNDNEIGNSFSRAIKEFQEDVEGKFPIYRTSPEKPFDITDSGWWFSNGASLGQSALGFAATGGLLGSGLKAIGAVNALGRVGSTLVTATALNQAESIPMASRAFDETLRKSLSDEPLYSEQEIKAITEKEVEEFYKTRKKELNDEYAKNAMAVENGNAMDNEISKNSAIEQQVQKESKEYLEELTKKYNNQKVNGPTALQAASEVGSYIMKINRANIALNVTSAGLFIKNPNIIKGLIEQPTKKAALKKVLGEGVQEYFEESVNFFSEQQGERKANELLKGEQVPFWSSKTSAKLASDFFSAEGQESAVLGFFGGVVQTGLTEGVYNNLKLNKTVKRDANGLIEKVDGKPVYEKVSTNTLTKRAYEEQQQILKNIKAVRDENGAYDVETILNEAATQKTITNKVMGLEYLLDPTFRLKENSQERSNVLVEKMGMPELKNATQEQIQEKIEELKQQELKNKVFYAASVNATQGLINMYEDLAKMSDEEIEKKGYNPEFRKIIQDNIESIKKYQKLYDSMPSSLKTIERRPVARVYFHAIANAKFASEAYKELETKKQQYFDEAREQWAIEGKNPEELEDLIKKNKDFEGSSEPFKKAIETLKKQNFREEEGKSYFRTIREILMDPDKFKENLEKKAKAQFKKEAEGQAKQKILEDLLAKQERKEVELFYKGEKGQLVQVEGQLLFKPDDIELPPMVVDDLNSVEIITQKEKAEVEEKMKSVEKKAEKIAELKQEEEKQREAKKETVRQYTEEELAKMEEERKVKQGKIDKLGNKINTLKQRIEKIKNRIQNGNKYLRDLEKKYTEKKELSLKEWYNLEAELENLIKRYKNTKDKRTKGPKAIKKRIAEIREELEFHNKILKEIEKTKKVLEELSFLKEDIKKQIVYYKNLIEDKTLKDLNKDTLESRITKLFGKIRVVEKLIKAAKIALNKSLFYVKEYMNIWINIYNDFEKFKSTYNTEDKRTIKNESKTRKKPRGKKRKFVVANLSSLKAGYEFLKAKLIEAESDKNFIKEIIAKEEKQIENLSKKSQNYQDQIRYLFELLEEADSGDDIVGPITAEEINPVLSQIQGEVETTEKEVVKEEKEVDEIEQKESQLEIALEEVEKEIEEEPNPKIKEKIEEVQKEVASELGVPYVDPSPEDDTEYDPGIPSKQKEEDEEGAKKTVFDTTTGPEYIAIKDIWDALTAKKTKGLPLSEDEENLLDDATMNIVWNNTLSKLGTALYGMKLKIVEFHKATEEEKMRYFSKKQIKWHKDNPVDVEGNINRGIRMVLQTAKGEDYYADIFGNPDDGGRPVTGSMTTNIVNSQKDIEGYGKLTVAENVVIPNFFLKKYDQIVSGKQVTYKIDGKDVSYGTALNMAVKYLTRLIISFRQEVVDFNGHPVVKILKVSKGIPFSKGTIGKLSPAIGSFVKNIKDINKVYLGSTSNPLMVFEKGLDTVTTKPGHFYIEDSSGNVVEAVNNKVTEDQANLIISLIEYGTKGGSKGLRNQIFDKDGNSYTIFYPVKGQEEDNILKKLIYWGEAKKGKNASMQIFVKDGFVIFGNNTISIEEMSSKTGQKYQLFYNFLLNKYQNGDLSLLQKSKDIHLQPIAIEDGKIVHRGIQGKGKLSGYESYLVEEVLSTRIERESETDPIVMNRYLKFSKTLESGTNNASVPQKTETTKPTQQTDPKIKIEKGSIVTPDMIVRDDLSVIDDEFIGDIVQKGNDQGKNTKVVKVNGSSEKGISVDIRVVTKDGAITQTVFIKQPTKQTSELGPLTEEEVIAVSTPRKIFKDRLDRINEFLQGKRKAATTVDGNGSYTAVIYTDKFSEVDGLGRDMRDGVQVLLTQEEVNRMLLIKAQKKSKKITLEEAEAAEQEVLKDVYTRALEQYEIVDDAPILDVEERVEAFNKSKATTDTTQQTSEVEDDYEIKRLNETLLIERNRLTLPYKAGTSSNMVLFDINGEVLSVGYLEDGKIVDERGKVPQFNIDRQVRDAIDNRNETLFKIERLEKLIEEIKTKTTEQSTTPKRGQLVAPLNLKFTQKKATLETTNTDTVEKVDDELKTTLAPDSKAYIESSEIFSLTEDEHFDIEELLLTWTFAPNSEYKSFDVLRALYGKVKKVNPQYNVDQFEDDLMNKNICVPF